MATTPVGVWGSVAHPLRLHRRCVGPLPRPIGMVCAPVGAVGTVVAAVQLLEQVRRGGFAHRDGHLVLWHERGTVSPARLARFRCFARTARAVVGVRLVLERPQRCHGKQINSDEFGRIWTYKSNYGTLMYFLCWS